MDDNTVAVELLKLYPQYEGEYTLVQFLNLFQAIRRFTPNRCRVATRIIKKTVRGSNEPGETEESNQQVLIDSMTLKVH